MVSVNLHISDHFKIEGLVVDERIPPAGLGEIQFDGVDGWRIE
jgi:hypothetical protein